MNRWTRWLPLAFVVWYARRKVERIKTPYGLYAIPFDDVLIKAED